ncbi:hypothetical protein R4P47_06915 [Rhodococcus sp. IEGM 1370]|uniref:hypothetical protein n=1 Tax=Rhodococcus sp. IEGM 1370 TaxID=3082222 RepID=UPI00295504EC|nr:hypothetical protein [Rhodococcus sp. IEGM 1370]MDV8076285.1 hypothetical protein [Rhodococcus sp. IEGM 1370]
MIEHPRLQETILRIINQGEIDLTDLLFEIRREHPEMPTTNVVRALAALIADLALIPTHVVHVKVIRPQQETP